MTHKEKWWKAMVERHGSKEAVLEFMRRNATKGGQQTRDRGHLNTYNFKARPELAREANRLSQIARKKA